MRAFERHLAAEPPDDHREFGLVVHLARQRRQNDRGARTHDRRRRLEEHHRIGRSLAAHLARMIGIGLARRPSPCWAARARAAAPRDSGSRSPVNSIGAKGWPAITATVAAPRSDALLGTLDDAVGDAIVHRETSNAHETGPFGEAKPELEHRQVSAGSGRGRVARACASTRGRRRRHRAAARAGARAAAWSPDPVHHHPRSSHPSSDFTAPTGVITAAVPQAKTSVISTGRIALAPVVDIDARLARSVAKILRHGQQRIARDARQQ